MPKFQFRCPNTGLDVQGFTAKEIVAGDAFETVECLACKQIHIVNLKTGRVVRGVE